MESEHYSFKVNSWTVQSKIEKHFFFREQIKWCILMKKAIPKKSLPLDGFIFETFLLNCSFFMQLLTFYTVSSGPKIF